MPRRKYILDPSDLQYKLVRLPWRHKILRFILWTALSVVVSILYVKVFETKFGSPKEKHLEQEIANIKLQYSLLNRKFADAFNVIDNLKQSDEVRYRPILTMDSIPSSIRNPGYGGVDRYRAYTGLLNSSLLISSHEKLDAIKNMAIVQEESFNAVAEKRDEWIFENDHLPKICPVDPKWPKGDGLKFREEHPVLGTPKWHFGQDFTCPSGTEVYATGAGKVIFAGWSNDGFGYHVIIDHQNGYRTIYGHLSKIEVPIGINVRRGKLIGLSGSTGTSSGPHLHYQIDLYGSHKNPLNFFRDDLTPDEYREMIMELSSKMVYR